MAFDDCVGEVQAHAVPGKLVGVGRSEVPLKELAEFLLGDADAVIPKRDDSGQAVAESRNVSMTLRHVQAII